MFKFSAIVLLVSVVHYTQCLPTINHVNTTSVAKQKIDLIIKNGTEATNYDLSPEIYELENETQLIGAVQDALLPYLNFLIDQPSGSQDCLDQVEVQFFEIN